MIVKKVDKVTKRIAILLVAFYAFPLIYGPAHHLFTIHYHSDKQHSNVVEAYHPSCKIDDFSYNEIDDIRNFTPIGKFNWPKQFNISIKSLLISSKLNFAYIFRAPPFLSELCCSQ